MGWTLGFWGFFWGFQIIRERSLRVVMVMDRAIDIEIEKIPYRLFMNSGILRSFAVFRGRGRGFSFFLFFFPFLFFLSYFFSYFFSFLYYCAHIPHPPPLPFSPPQVKNSQRSPYPIYSTEYIRTKHLAHSLVSYSLYYRSPFHPCPRGLFLISLCCC